MPILDSKGPRKSSNSSEIKSLKKDTINGFLWLISGSGAHTVLKIIVLSILARLVTPYEFGIIGVALIVIGFSQLFSQMGMGPAIVQRSKIDSSHIRTGFTSSLLLGLILALLLFFAAPNISLFFNMPELTTVLRVISSIFVVDSFIVISKSLLQRKMNLKFYAFAEIISYTLGYGLVGIVLAYLDFGIWALVFGHLARAIVEAIFVSWLEPHSIIPYWNQKAFKELFYYGGGFTISKVGNFFARQGDNLIVGKLLGADALGFYSRAYQIMVAPANLIGNSLSNALFPAMSTVQHDISRLQNAYLKASKIVGLVSLPMSFIIVLNAREIVLILLGGNWVNVILPLQILASGLLFRVGYKISDALARALGVVYKRAWRQLVYTATVFCGAYFGHFLGIAGVAMGTILAVFINFILMTHLGLSQLNISWAIFLKIYSKPMVLTVLVVAVSYPLISGLRDFIVILLLREFLFLVLLFSVVSSIIYVFRAFFEIEEEIDNVYLKLKNKLIRWRK